MQKSNLASILVVVIHGASELKKRLTAEKMNRQQVNIAYLKQVKGVEGNKISEEILKNDR